MCIIVGKWEVTFAFSGDDNEFIGDVERRVLRKALTQKIFLVVHWTALRILHINYETTGQSMKN